MNKHLLYGGIRELLAFGIIDLLAISALVALNISGNAKIWYNVILIVIASLFSISFVISLVFYVIKLYARCGKKTTGVILDVFQVWHKRRPHDYVIEVKYTNEFNKECKFYDKISWELFDLLSKDDIIPIRVHGKFGALIPNEVQDYMERTLKRRSTL